ncbi:class I SAM-dependent methyltransferase [Methylobacterium sp. WSM2598]|uniref:class I SAM-dependent methyltransferase n=1 Tax=Methylobacterium sp. WSM2598 TaxID=398261 RepID=UPI000365FBD3|nr:class I SAM-dependent methyltransferase [Methylobacterium sp. WSM2598]
MQDLYDRSFYGEQRSGSLNSALIVAPMVCAIFAPRSVLDLGCGVGTWLKAFSQAGVADVAGIDGDYVSRDDLEIAQEHFTPRDLTTEITFDRRFDLAMSLEVGEHLPTDKAPVLVRSLSNAADVVLFSAAIPYQGGIGHINCQWQSWWADLFAREGYEAFDLFRPALWNDGRVEAWYRQNMLVYARHAGAETARAHLRGGGLPLDVVHPAELERGMLGVPRVSHVIEDLKLALGRRIRSSFGAGGPVQRSRSRYGLS